MPPAPPPVIQHTERPHETVVADARGCLAAFGGLFVLSGLTAIALGVADGSVPGWTRLVVVGIGLAHLAGGLLAGWGESRASVARAGGVAVTHRRLFRPTATRDVPARAVEWVEVEEGRDSDGDATFRVRLRLYTGERVPLTTHSAPAREPALAAAEAVARRLALPDRVGW